MLELISGHLTARALHAFAQLGVADLLDRGPRACDEIATITGCAPDPLYRLLRFMAAIDVLTEQEARTFRLTPLGQTLCRQPTSVMRDAALLMGSSFYWDALAKLPDAIVSGRNAFERAHGRRFFDYLADGTEAAAVFAASRRSSLELEASAILSSYNYGQFGTIVDVGGGTGGLLMRMLARHPSVRGILYDAAVGRGEAAGTRSRRTAASW